MKCPQQANPETKSRYISGCRQGNGLGVSELNVNRYNRTSLWGDENVGFHHVGVMAVQPRECTKNVLRTTQLYTVKGWILWYVHYDSINKRKKHQM